MSIRLLALVLGSSLLLCSASAEAAVFRRGDYHPTRRVGCSDSKFYARVAALTNGKNATGQDGDAITFKGKLYGGTAQSLAPHATGKLGKTIDAFVGVGRSWQHLLRIDPARSGGSGYFDVLACSYMHTQMIGDQQPDFLPTDAAFTNHHEYGFGVEATPAIFQAGYEPVVADPKYLTYWIIYVIPRSTFAGGDYDLAVRGG